MQGRCTCKCTWTWHIETWAQKHTCTRVHTHTCTRQCTESSEITKDKQDRERESCFSKVFIPPSLSQQHTSESRKLSLSVCLFGQCMLLARPKHMQVPLSSVFPLLFVYGRRLAVSSLLHIWHYIYYASQCKEILLYSIPLIVAIMCKSCPFVS